MAALAYIVLCHGAPKPVVALTELLLAADDTGQVVIHYDARSSQEDFATLQEAVRESERAHLVPDRVACGWGDFSLVEGVLRALRLIRDRDLPCDHVYLMSGSCLPVRPIALLKRFLDRHPRAEFIQTEGPSWIVGGLRDERHQYYHWFSEIRHKTLFDYCVLIQQKLHIRRRIPRGIVPKFGSQWWCLTAETCWNMLEFLDQYKSYYRFFKKTYIPDEMFFQSLVFHLVGSERISGKSLTFSEFSHQGRATVFFDDNLDFIRRLPHFFARKISPRARQVREYSAEVAAKPHGGVALPAIRDLRPPVLFRDRARAQIESPRPGQIFYGDQLSQQGWPGVLRSSMVAFGVLYGPPGLTQLAVEALRTVPGVSFFGRIFRQDKVDFGPCGPVFKGLKEADNLIRARDTPLYLARLLERAEGFPVIEVAPDDDHDSVNAVWDLSNAVILPCIPLSAEDEEWRRLYWTLSALAPPGTLTPETGSHIFLRRTIDQYIDRRMPRERRDWLWWRTLQSLGNQRLVPLYFDIERGQRRALTKQQRVDEKKLQAIVTAVGPTILPLLGAIDRINTQLCNLSPRQLLELLPPVWQAYFEVILEPPSRPNRVATRRFSIVGRDQTAAAED